MLVIVVFNSCCCKVEVADVICVVIGFNSADFWLNAVVVVVVEFVSWNVISVKVDSIVVNVVVFVVWDEAVEFICCSFVVVVDIVFPSIKLVMLRVLLAVVLFDSCNVFSLEVDSIIDAIVDVVVVSTV